MVKVSFLDKLLNYSLAVQIKFDEDCTNEDIGDENFINDVKNWDDTDAVKKRKSSLKNLR